MSDWTRPERPLSIAHRGASAYAPDCSLEAYQKAAALGADMWEVDIRLSADRSLFAFHDAAFPDGTPLSRLTADQVLAEAARQSVPAEPLDRVLALASKSGTGIYADIKDTEATLPTLKALQMHGIERAIVGAFDPEAARLLAEVGCSYPRSALVPIGADPFEYAQGADVVHLCWEKMDSPQDMLTEAFFAEADRRGQRVVVWHEEDPRRMAVLRRLPVLGICSDRPELVHPWKPDADWPFEIVCHRGACEFAPENTLEAAHCAFSAGFQVVELDVHSTLDGGLAVIHDVTLDRTTNGRGAVGWHDSTTLDTLDAGSRYSPHFRDQKVPTLGEMLELAQLYDGRLYIELKAADPAAVLDCVTSHDALDRCFFWSSDFHRLRELRARARQAALMVRRQDQPSLEHVLALNPSVVEFTAEEDFSEFGRCRSAGAKPMIAYMGRSEAMFAKLIEARPDMLNLHFPFAFRNHLKSCKHPL